MVVDKSTLQRLPALSKPVMFNIWPRIVQLSRQQSPHTYKIYVLYIHTIIRRCYCCCWYVSKSNFTQESSFLSRLAWLEVSCFFMQWEIGAVHQLVFWLIQLTHSRFKLFWSNQKLFFRSFLFLAEKNPHF